MYNAKLTTHLTNKSKFSVFPSDKLLKEKFLVPSNADGYSYIPTKRINTETKIKSLRIINKIF